MSFVGSTTYPTLGTRRCRHHQPRRPRPRRPYPPRHPSPGFATEDPVHWTEEQDGSGFWSILRTTMRWRLAATSRRSRRPKGIRLEEMDEEETEARRTDDGARPTRSHPLPPARRARGSPDDGSRATRMRSASSPSRSSRKHSNRPSSISCMPSLSSCRCACSAACLAPATRTATNSWPGAMLCSATPTRVHRLPGRPHRHRTVPDGAVSQPGVDPDLPVGASPGRRTPRQPDRRPDLTNCSNRRRDGVPLTDHEFNNFVTLLVAAGNDTTRYTMTHGVWT